VPTPSPDERAKKKAREPLDSHAKAQSKKTFELNRRAHRRQSGGRTVSQKNGNSSESGHVRILPLTSLKPSPVNNQVYRPVSSGDSAVADLALSIERFGLREPIVITRDHFILSGHRRFVACQLAGLSEVPCRIEDISSKDSRFVPLLTAYNQQRVKSLDEFMREALVNTEPSEAYESLLEYREQRSQFDKDSLQSIELRDYKARAKISPAKLPLLQAAREIIELNHNYWPLTDRQIHYQVLNRLVLRHASKPDSTYRNNKNCYGDLCDLLTRARLEGFIPWQAITDETRTSESEGGFRNPQAFIKQDVDNFLRDYSRNLLQSQPNHVELVGEKNTVQGIIARIHNRYCLPYTIGRGFCSIERRHRLIERYRRSGKQKLVLLVLSDFDPSGEEIAHSFARSLRDDFGIPERRIEGIKVAITADQVQQYELEPIMSAKEKDSNYARFVDRHGDDVFELEALTPAQLEDILTDAIDAVLDIDAFNTELEQEKKDAAFLAAKRTAIFDFLRQAGLEEGGEGE
jgi:hypothetical protein